MREARRGLATRIHRERGPLPARSYDKTTSSLVVRPRVVLSCDLGGPVMRPRSPILIYSICGPYSDNHSNDQRPCAGWSR